MKKKEPKHLKRARARAGKRKCRRCKEVFYRAKGEIFTICLRCREHCARCDTLLTEKNKDLSASRLQNYLCKKCTAEMVRNTRDKTKQRDYDLLRNYGITVNEYEAMLNDQNGVCWICEKPPAKVRLSVDHLHEKGERRRNPKLIRKRVRGLLCWQCNQALGKFRDNPDFLRKAADYLEACPAQRVLKGRLGETDGN